MDRVCGRLLAAVRVLLVALSVALMGAAPSTERARATAELGPQPAHADGVADPDPSPAVAGPRDEDPRGEDDEPGHGPRRDSPVLAAVAGQVDRIRGPPPGLTRATWRPRSSRGPPEPV